MRFDQWLHENGFFDSREKSRREILAGRVRRGGSGEILDKPGMKVPKGLQVNIEEKQRFVGRGGEKLLSFLKVSQLDPQKKICIDVGSSTGGFTDCLLQHGADRVYAIDVGTHQMHESLRNDPRVALYEQTDIREFDFSGLDAKPDWIVVDVSFISLQKILKPLVQNFPDSTYILLFKPQFEADRRIPRKRGVVSDRDRKKSLEEMLLFLEGLGLNPKMILDSAVKGIKGNQETFIMANNEFPAHIFRTYDIRGVAERDLTDSLVKKIGFILGQEVLKSVDKRPRIGIGRDERLSSPRVLRALTAGLSHHDVDLIYLGSVPTPMVYFANYHLDLDAAFQITASHNPKEDNGIKMMLGKDALFGPQIEDIGRRAKELKLPTEIVEVKYADEAYGKLREDYLSYLHDQFRFSRKFKILVDSGNGMAGVIIRDVLKSYAEKLEILYEKVDCTFPNHEADPTVPQNLIDLQTAISKTSADVGFAFDGDGDRLGVITPKGRIIWGDEILMLLSQKVLKDNPGATIIGEVKCSQKLFSDIEKNGGKPIMYRTGHSLIKKKMKETKAAIAGEMSGHLFFADRYFGFDDAAYASLRVLEVIDQMDLDLDEWIEQYPKTFVTPEIRVTCREDEKESLIQRVREDLEKRKDCDLTLIDGVRANFKDGSWVLVRASNTQAVLVVRIEALSKERLEELKNIVQEPLGRQINV